MQKRNSLSLAIVLSALLAAVCPATAAAAICFSGGGATFVIEIAATAGRFFSLVGAWVLEGQSTPITGNAYLRSTGVAHIAGTLPAHSPVNDAFTFEGTLDPPSYNTGSMTFQRLTSPEDASSVTLTAAVCPPVPEEAVPFGAVGAPSFPWKQ